LDLVVAGVALIGVGLASIAFRLVTVRVAKDDLHDWCQTSKLGWNDDDRWYIFAGGLILIGVCLVAAGIV